MWNAPPMKTSREILHILQARKKWGGPEETRVHPLFSLPTSINPILTLFALGCGVPSAGALPRATGHCSAVQLSDALSRSIHGAPHALHQLHTHSRARSRVCDGLRNACT